VASLNLIPSIALVPKTICTLAVQRARRSTKKRRGEIMVTFVLVHGAWHGAWCWRRVAQRLTARGHEVFTPTLTGVAERSHLLRGDIDLDTQILDVVNVMKWQGLKDVVLVGHSYGGMVVSGVAEKMEKAIASFVMLDAFFPEDGQSLIDVNVPPDRVRDAILTAERSGATVMPPPPAAMFNVNEQERTWVDAQCTPHPIKCFTQKLALTGARDRVARKAYIRAASFPSPPSDHGLATARAKGWRVYEVACGHDVMLDTCQPQHAKRPLGCPNRSRRRHNAFRRSQTPRTSA
jgi:pimeloyl-ACP methyl ester carboxylesterase